MSRRKDTGDGREEKEEEKREGAEGGEKYLYVGGSECWPLAPNQEGQGPVPFEMTRYCPVFCRIASGSCRYLPIAEFFFFLYDRQLDWQWRRVAILLIGKRWIIT